MVKKENIDGKRCDRVGKRERNLMAKLKEQGLSNEAIAEDKRVRRDPRTVAANLAKLESEQARRHEDADDRRRRIQHDMEILHKSREAMTGEDLRRVLSDLNESYSYLEPQGQKLVGFVEFFSRDRLHRYATKQVEKARKTLCKLLGELNEFLSEEFKFRDDRRDPESGDCLNPLRIMRNIRTPRFEGDNPEERVQRLEELTRETDGALSAYEEAVFKHVTS